MRSRIVFILMLVAGVSVVQAEGVVLSAGRTLSVALTPDGRVFQWGEIGGLVPVPVFGIDHVKAVDAGERFAVALKNDGTVWTWGANNLGQLGDGSLIDHDRPVQVSGLSGITAIAAGSNHAYALKNDGTMVAWGDNRNGQLGDGTRVSRRYPVPVENFSGVKAIAAGTGHLLTLRTDGTVCSWGLVDDLETSPSVQSVSISNPLPVCITEFSGVTAIAAGGSGSYALRQDGTLWSWGSPVCGQGGSLASHRFEPPLLNHVTAISASPFRLLALRDDGTVWACGSNEARMLGTGSSKPWVYTPESVVGLSSITEISAGFRYALAHGHSGALWAWGENDLGQLGVGDRSPRTLPSAVWDGSGELTQP